MVNFCKSNKDQKTKRSNGPYCGDEMPPSFLSDSEFGLVVVEEVLKILFGCVVMAELSEPEDGSLFPSVLELN